MVLRLTGFALSLFLVAVLLNIVWGFGGGYVPRLETPQTAMWDVFTVCAGLMIYMAIQAIAAAKHPSGRSSSWIFDIVASLLPLFTAGAAFVWWWFGRIDMDDFQLITVVLTIMATLIDLVLFSLLLPERDAHAARTLPQQAR
jgi:hypothetical protein